MIIGSVLAIMMGGVLGLLGGGGSILSVPILVYVFGIPAVLATGYSLFVVGLTSGVGAVSYIRRGLVDVRLGLVFAVSSLLGVLVSRKLVLPSVPLEMNVLGAVLSKDVLVMLVFAVLVIGIGAMMIFKRGGDALPVSAPGASVLRLVGMAAVGVFVGVLTGFVGAGGGFMIVPALVFFGALDMRRAVGTSLLVISISALSGFLADLSEGVLFNWVFLLAFTGFTLVGVVLGAWLNSRLPVGRLRQAFGYFVLVMGVFILLKEII